MLLQANYCSCIVHQARNLPDKGKHGGVDAFCTISMGKEKFVTAVREKTRSPDWEEQCDMPIAEDSIIKLTVYHNNKNALSKGDFVGRVYVSLRDLQDYDHVHRGWYKLTNKDGKTDKERGEIDVSLQFYSKNNTTGSVLDLATKKKHLSLKDIKQSLGSKLKTASKHRKSDNFSGDNQLAEQRRRLGGGEDSTYNVRDFLDDSASESTSIAGSHMSLNSEGMISPPPLSTEHSRSFSVTGDDIEAAFDAISDYKTSVNDSSSNKTREHEMSSPDSLFGLSTIKEATDTDEFILGTTSSRHHKDEDIDDIDFDNCFNKYKHQQEKQQTTEKKPIEEKPNKKLAPSTPVSQKSQKPQEIKQETRSSHHSKEQKRTAPIHTDVIPTPSVSMPITKVDLTPTPTVTVSTTKPKDTSLTELDDSNDSIDEDVDELLGKLERMSSIRSSVKRKIQPKDDIMQQSFSENSCLFFQQLSFECQHRPINLKYSTLQTDKKIQSRVLSFDDIDDIATPSIDIDTKNVLDSPANNKFLSGYTQNQSSSFGNRTDRNGPATLPDIVGEQSGKNLRQGSSQHQVSSSVSSNTKPNDNGLCVLGYQNVKSAPVHPKVRQELDYLDREELLHVIAYQSDLLKKRDTRLKDLESYTDSLLVKILEQCPTILQVGTYSSTSAYRK
ncbi:unnamed protein product [Rotaria socialis]|uniref:Rab11 family-interacting protein 1 n=1 Tax=Rotaria socialis TaxID=392032 RepID=A0A820BXN6_9BILA|nr:unnamed protein product [Rotaria socialis]